MEAVNDLAHFSALVKEIKVNNRQIFTNCYLLPGDINKYTGQGRMFWQKAPDRVVFLCEEKDFYSLYFYILESQIQHTDIQFHKSRKPIVMDIVCLDTDRAQTLARVEKNWRGDVFHFHKTYRRMQLNMSVYKPLLAEKELNRIAYRISRASPAHLEEIQRLWRSSLDVFSTALPSEEELKQLISEGQIVCALDVDGCVAAALQFVREGKTCTIKHVTVNEAHRRRGLAEALVHTCIVDNQGINKYYLWVDESNFPAVELYLKNGFQFDGKVTCQFLLER